MTGFFDRMLGRDNKKGSSSTAKDRLQFVLLHERMNIPPEKLREMKQEIMDVIAKYVPEIEHDSVEIAIEQSDRYNNKLIAEIPFSKSRTKAAADDNTDDEANTTGDEREPLDSDSENFNEMETVKSKAIQEAESQADQDTSDDDTGVDDHPGEDENDE